MKNDLNVSSILKDEEDELKSQLPSFLSSTANTSPSKLLQDYEKTGNSLFKNAAGRALQFLKDTVSDAKQSFSDNAGQALTGVGMVAGMATPRGRNKILKEAAPHIFEGLVRNIKKAGSGSLIKQLHPVDFKSFDDVVKTKAGRQAVDEIKDKILAGEDVGPITIKHVDGKSFVEDGHHRVQAYKELGFEVVPSIEKSSEKKAELKSIFKETPPVKLKTLEEATAIPSSVGKLNQEASKMYGSMQNLVSEHMAEQAAKYPIAGLETDLNLDVLRIAQLTAHTLKNKDSMIRYFEKELDSYRNLLNKPNIEEWQIPSLKKRVRDYEKNIKDFKETGMLPASTVREYIKYELSNQVSKTALPGRSIFAATRGSMGVASGGWTPLDFNDRFIKYLSRAEQKGYIRIVKKNGKNYVELPTEENPVILSDTYGAKRKARIQFKRSPEGIQQEIDKHNAKLEKAQSIKNKLEPKVKPLIEKYKIEHDNANKAREEFIKKLMKKYGAPYPTAVFPIDEHTPESVKKDSVYHLMSNQDRGKLASLTERWSKAIDNDFLNKDKEIYAYKQAVTEINHRQRIIEEKTKALQEAKQKGKAPIGTILGGAAATGVGVLAANQAQKQEQGESSMFDKVAPAVGLFAAAATPRGRKALGELFIKSLKTGKLLGSIPNKYVKLVDSDKIIPNSSEVTNAIADVRAGKTSPSNLPLLVKETPNGMYELLDGNHRYAQKVLGVGEPEMHIMTDEKAYRELADIEAGDKLWEESMFAKTAEPKSMFEPVIKPAKARKFEEMVASGDADKLAEDILALKNSKDRYFDSFELMRMVVGKKYNIYNTGETPEAMKDLVGSFGKMSNKQQIIDALEFYFTKGLSKESKKPVAWLKRWIGRVGDFNKQSNPSKETEKFFNELNAKPEEPITVYRSIPEEDELDIDDKLFTSWTTDRSVAEDWGDFGYGQRVVERQVSPDQILVEIDRLPQHFKNAIGENFEEHEVIVKPFKND